MTWRVHPPNRRTWAVRLQSKVAAWNRIVALVKRPERTPLGKVRALMRAGWKVGRRD